jgi:tRNA pseudouridine38-40 synthase
MLQSQPEYQERTLALVVEYQGTGYQGFQVQPDRRTIQGTLEEALEGLLGKQIKTQGAGRTDAGVHALAQVVAFTTQAEYSPEVFLQALNARLPMDIRIQGAYEVDPGFDPRRHASSREYQYLFLERERTSAIWREFVYQVRGTLNVEAMNQAAGMLVGLHGLRSFSDARGGWSGGSCNVLQSKVVRKHDLVVLTMEAQAFLPHQVRRTAGALLRVGKEEMSVSEFGCMVDQDSPGTAGPTLPSTGLCLTKVAYLKFASGRPIRRENGPWLPVLN